MSRIKNLIINDTKSQFQFLSMDELLNDFIRHRYPKKSVVVFPNSKSAFTEEVRLLILKRDDLRAYLKGIIADIAFVVFDSRTEALDYSYNFQQSTNIKVFINGELHG